MIELILSVCLLNQPTRCKDERLSYVADMMTPYTCVMRAQPELAKWSAAHPKWRIEKWTCRRPDSVAKI